MATINAIQCGESIKNTGTCGCFFDPKNAVGFILIPRSKVLTQAEIDVIQTTLEAGVLASKANRFFPVQNLVALTDNSEDPTFQTFGYGSTAPVREGNYNWVFQFLQGGVQLSNSLRTFNGTSKYVPLFIFRDAGKHFLVGTKKLDVNGNTGLAGVPQEGGYPYTYPWKANDGTNVAQYRVQFMFQPDYINNNIAFVEVSNSTYMLTELTGLEDVTLTQLEVAGDTVTVSAATTCGSDLYSDEGFADELAQAAAWTLYDADGNEVDIESVVKNESEGGWTITAAEEILNDFKLSLAAPAVLAASPINVNGYESAELEIDFGS